MKIFISWSGEPSRSIALALRNWLPLIVQHVKPWVSDEEIGSGTRWNDLVGAALEDTDFGIVCVTAPNQHKPWLMFEAGALAKRLATARVVPLCIDLPPAEITGPLEAFQARCLDEDGMRRLVHDISRVRDEPLADDQVDALFSAMWPQLEESVERAKRQAPLVESPRRRSNQEMLEELVDKVRRLERTQRPPSTLAPGDTVTVNGQTIIVGTYEQARRIEGLVAAGRLEEGSARIISDDGGYLRKHPASTGEGGVAPPTE